MAATSCRAPLSSQDSERQIPSDQIDSDIAFTWSFADLGSFPLLPVAWQSLSRRLGVSGRGG